MASLLISAFIGSQAYFLYKNEKWRPKVFLENLKLADAKDYKNPAVVIGRGIGGISMALELGKRNFQVLLIQPEDELEEDYSQCLFLPNTLPVQNQQNSIEESKKINRKKTFYELLVDKRGELQLSSALWDFNFYRFLFKNALDIFRRSSSDQERQHSFERSLSDYCLTQSFNHILDPIPNARDSLLPLSLPSSAIPPLSTISSSSSSPPSSSSAVIDLPALQKTLEAYCESTYGVQIKKTPSIQDLEKANSNTYHRDFISRIYLADGYIQLQEDTPIVLSSNSNTASILDKVNLYLPIYPIQSLCVDFDKRKLLQQHVGCFPLEAKAFSDGSTYTNLPSSRRIRLQLANRVGLWSKGCEGESVTKALHEQSLAIMQSLGVDKVLEKGDLKFYVSKGRVIEREEIYTYDDAPIAGGVSSLRNLYVLVAGSKLQLLGLSPSLANSIATLSHEECHREGSCYQGNPLYSNVMDMIIPPQRLPHAYSLSYLFKYVKTLLASQETSPGALGYSRLTDPMEKSK